MRKTILAVMMLGASAGALASDEEEVAAFQKKVDHVMVDILCKTHVIHDMGVLGDEYLPKLDQLSDPAAKRKVNAEFGDKLHQAWLNQKFDMSQYQDVVAFLQFLNDKPISNKAWNSLAGSWTRAAQHQCPAVADDYRKTLAAALSLTATVLH